MPGSGKKVEVTIEKGESTKMIGAKLGEKNLIGSDLFFYLYMKFKEKTIKPGDYLLPNNLSIVKIAGILENGEHQVKKIIIPEGWRREQIAAYLADQAKINPDEFMSKTKDLEGKLFPDTYDLTDEPTADEVIKKMTDDYASRISGLSVSNDMLIIASIVEREAANDAERADIAGVFTNRLAKGMKLEADPTVQYQKDNDNYPKVGILNFKFWQKLTNGDIKNIKGPFSTYQNAGLPPAPICNPGLASIKAALTPSKHNYLYFLHGTDGKIYFAATEADHNANKAKYLK